MNAADARARLRTVGERDDGQITLHKRTVVLDRAPRTVLSLLPFRTPSEGTVKVRTRGIEHERSEWEHWLDRRGRLRATHGVLLMAGTRELLREWAYACLRLAADDRGDEAEDSTSIMIERGRALETEAEVQTYRSFALWCEQARMIREQLFPGRSRSPLTDDERRTVREALPPRERD